MNILFSDTPMPVPQPNRRTPLPPGRFPIPRDDSDEDRPVRRVPPRRPNISPTVQV